MFKNYFKVTWTILFLFTLFCCQPTNKNKEDLPIRILKTGFHFDGGTIEITYLTQKDIIVKLFVDNRKIPITSSRKADTGRIYLDKYPDDINFLNNKARILEIAKDLKLWLDKNLIGYTSNSGEDYEIELNNKLEKSGILDAQYAHTLMNISDVFKALNLINKKYPELIGAEKLPKHAR